MLSTVIAKCLEFLGHRCQLRGELPLLAGTPPLPAAESADPRGGVPPAGVPPAGGAAPDGAARLVRPRLETDLDDIFRRDPPWVYPPLAMGTILVATRRSAGASAIEQYHKLERSSLPLSSVVSFHRVRPTSRTAGLEKDPRCRIYASYSRLESGPAHWNSRCLPNFVLLGTPKSGTTSLFNWIVQHPDLRAPLRKELHFWAPVLVPEKGCLDREECEALASRGDRRRGPNWPLSTGTVGRMLAAYLELYPRIDPRDFAISGEASPAYMYSPSAALFFESALMKHARLLLLLREPSERAFSEFKNKRDLMIKGSSPKATYWVGGHRRFSSFVAELRSATAGCAPHDLYAACSACRRFAAAPAAPPPFVPRAELAARASVAQSGAAEVVTPAELAAAAARRNASGGPHSCAVAPVIWQSWYHLFLQRYLRRNKMLLIEFSDDLFANASGVMSRVASFLQLPDFAFRTSVAYNTESHRGAFISSGDGANAADAKTAAHKRTAAAEADMRFVRGLMSHSVEQTQRLLEETAWVRPPEQHRRALPRSWLDAHGVVPVEAPH